MTIKGIITKVLPEECGTSKATGKEWKKANYVLTSLDKYPTECKFDVFGADRIQELNLQVGQKVELEGSIESREWNGHYYSDIHIWRRIDEPTAATPTTNEPF